MQGLEKAVPTPDIIKMEQKEQSKVANPVNAPKTYFSTEDTPTLIEEKKKLRLLGYPKTETIHFVDTRYNKDAYAPLLNGKNNTYLVIPSTSGENFIPDILADRLSEDFGGIVVKGFGENMSANESKNKAGYIKKNA